jgi:hypothetical protein
MGFRRWVLPWVYAALVFCIIESAVYLIFRPDMIQKSDFLITPINNSLQMPHERWYLIEKFHALETGHHPTIVHVGDSSGMFGLMPDVIEGYLGHNEVLNFSCCGNQGFHGYLAALEVALRKFKSLKYIVVNMAPVVYPRPNLWWDTNGDFWAVPGMSVLGAEMQHNFVSPWRLLYPPSNALRPRLTSDVLKFGLDLRNATAMSVDREYGTMFERRGYMLEHDITLVPACSTEVPRDDNGTSYLELFVADFVKLAKRHGVTPVLIFHPTACDPGPQYDAFNAELDRVRKLYPELRVPEPLPDTWPQNFFSVPAHAERGVAIETSRRFGRAMRQILIDDKLLPADAAPPPIPVPAQAGPIKIFGARIVDTCDYYNDEEKHYRTDLTAEFMRLCDGKSSCSYAKGTAPGEPPPAAKCFPTYTVTYQCAGEPVRTIREEHVNTPDPNGLFTLDCAQTTKLASDPMPYGIQVLQATIGANVGGTFGNATMWAQASCDGLFDCNPDITSRQFIQMPQPGSQKDVEVDYFCGTDATPRHRYSLAGAASIHLTCNNLPSDVKGIQIVTATYGGNVGGMPGNANLILREHCEERESCAIKVDVNELGDPSLGKEKDFQVSYRCGSEPTLRTAQPNHMPGHPDGFGYGEQLEISCAGFAASPADHMTVLSATSGATCGAPPDNALLLARSACENSQQCTITVTSDLPGNSAPTCAREFTARFRCANDGLERSISIPGSGAAKLAALLDCVGTAPRQAYLNLR